MIEPVQERMIEELWSEFMRRPFLGQPLWVFIADHFDTRQKLAFHDAFMGMEVFLEAMFLHEAVKQFTKSKGRSNRLPSNKRGSE